MVRGQFQLQQYPRQLKRRQAHVAHANKMMRGPIFLHQLIHYSCFASPCDFLELAIPICAAILRRKPLPNAFVG